ncbi:hypothetical protein [Rickettsia asembonensis]|uniref:hypothetical protein n=1 Tax=Rickettsia asembonensis TaxID=1068590 RepID=UPI001F516C21|nr:hypothetical protein [Rickettsia asembonensis]
MSWIPWSSHGMTVVKLSHATTLRSFAMTTQYSCGQCYARMTLPTFPPSAISSLISNFY